MYNLCACYGAKCVIEFARYKRFGLIINTQSQLCHIRNPEDICGNVRVQHVEVCSSMYYRCTVRQAYTINSLTKISINVQFVDKLLENKYLYKTVKLYDCTCAITSNILFSTCKESVPYKAVIWPKKIMLEYNPIIRQNLKPQTDFFQLYICPDIPIGVNYITDEPSGWEISEQQGLSFEQGGF